MVDTRDKSPLLPIGGKSPITASSSRLFCLHMTIAVLTFFCLSLLAAFVVTSKTSCYTVIPPDTTINNTICNTTTTTTTTANITPPSPTTTTTTLSFVPLDPLALPSVAIIGTPKGGTTDLQNQIISTWSDIMIKPITKELRDLADWDGTSTLVGSLNHQLYAERLNHPCATAINSTTQSFIHCTSNNNNKGRYTIDADPSYLENPAVPLSLRSISPTTKIIILLRDPVSRAESLLNQWASRCTDPKVLQSSAFCTTPIDEYATDFIDQMVTNDTVSFRFNLLLDSITPDDSYDDDSDIKTALLYSEIVEAGLLDWGSRKLFTSSLYSYSLASWNLHYFRPGRVLIIDSHVYFTKRDMVMERVSRFLFDKPLIDDDDKEDVLNRKWGAYRNNTRLSDDMKARLVEFYRPHTMKLLDEVLPRLKRRSGVELVGFERETREEWLG